MKTNVEIAKLANMLKVKPETLIPLEEMVRYPENNRCDDMWGETAQD